MTLNSEQDNQYAHNPQCSTEKETDTSLTYAPWSSEAAYHLIPTCDMYNPHPQWQSTDISQERLNQIPAVHMS